jgi:tetratricopeptide (TPR) repeat protein
MAIRFGRALGAASVLIACILGLPAFAGEAQWVEVRSPNFSVVTDAGEKRGRDVALHFEQMKAVFGALLIKANVNLPIPLQIVAFRNTKEMRQVAPLWHGKPTQVSGLFQSAPDRCFIMLDMSVENPWQVVFHEYAHQLMNGNLSGEIDPWFEEGFAEYFSSIEVDSKGARVGKIPEITYRILQQDGMMRIADLLRVQHNSKTYNESGDHRTVFYAESGLLVHYLYDNQLATKLAQYYDLLDEKKPIEEAVQQAFGMSVAQFDKVLRNYMSGGRYKYYALPTPAGIASTGYTTKPVTALDAAAVVADIHLHSLDYHDKAMEELQDILKADPNHPAALRGLGYGYLEKGDFEHASEYLRRAAEGDSKDPRVHYYVALLMNRSSGFGSGDERARMRKELETSIALNPDFADAYSMLAFVQINSGDNDSALQSARKAVSLNLRNEIYQYNLAEICIGAGKLDEAAALLKHLGGSSNPEVVSRANWSLEALEQLKKAVQQSASSVANGAAPVKRFSADHPAEPQFQGEEATRSEVVPGIVQATTGAVKFLKGKVAKVDCSTAPAAIMAIVSGAKTWTMHIRDSNHVIVIGAEKFSCEWTNQRVAINYREKSDGDGEVVSVELQ